MSDLVQLGAMSIGQKMLENLLSTPDSCRRIAISMRSAIEDKAAYIAKQPRTLSTLDLLIVEKEVVQLHQADQLTFVQLAALKDRLGTTLAKYGSLTTTEVASNGQ